MPSAGPGCSVVRFVRGSEGVWVLRVRTRLRPPPLLALSGLQVSMNFEGSGSLRVDDINAINPA